MSGARKNVAGIVAMIALCSIGATLACSSSSSPAAPPPCNQDPFECTTGQTCWVETDETTFACLNAGPGTVGSACQALAGTPGCGAGLFCLQTTAAGGQCLQFCDPTDPSHACPNAGPCQEAAFNTDTSSTVYLCTTATTTPADSGTTTPAEAGAQHEAATD